MNSMKLVMLAILACVAIAFTLPAEAQWVDQGQWGGWNRGPVGGWGQWGGGPWWGGTPGTPFWYGTEWPYGGSWYFPWGGEWQSSFPGIILPI